VIESNKRNSGYGIFFPTTAIKKSAYFKVGGLSTIRRHSSDTQFYLKSYFFLNMENVDEFLYIRTKRPNSLTTAPDTALGTIVRKRLHKQWRSDFLRMKHLNADLALSTLIDEKNVVNIEVVPLKGENIDLILSWQKFQQQIREKSITQPTKGTALLDGENILKDRLLSFKIAKVMHADGFKPTPTWLISSSVSVVVLAFISRMPGIKRYLKVLLSYFWKY